jgi:hypothetical protein
MADHDRKPDSSIIGQDADAANMEHQLGQTTSESAGGNVTGTGADACDDLDIVFEFEGTEATRH